MLISGLMLLGSVPAQEVLNNTTETQTIYVTSEVSQEISAADIDTDATYLWSKSPVFVVDPVCNENAELDLNEIAFIEEEPKIELGFDTTEYLPEGFDPYELYVDLNAVEYIDGQEEIELGFNVADYLPTDFNAYANPSDIASISYIEEEQIELGFDTAAYLPANFDPYFSTSSKIEVTVL